MEVRIAPMSPQTQLTERGDREPVHSPEFAQHFTANFGLTGPLGHLGALFSARSKVWVTLHRHTQQ